MASLDPAMCSGTNRNSCFGKSTASSGSPPSISTGLYVSINMNIAKYGTPISKIGVPYFYQHFRYCTLFRKGIGVDVIDPQFLLLGIFALRPITKEGKRHHEKTNTSANRMEQFIQAVNA